MTHRFPSKTTKQPKFLCFILVQVEKTKLAASLLREEQTILQSITSALFFPSLNLPQSHNSPPVPWKCLRTILYHQQYKPPVPNCEGQENLHN